MTTWEPIYPQTGDTKTSNTGFHFPDLEVTIPVANGKTLYERLAESRRKLQQKLKEQSKKRKRALKSISRLRIHFK